MSDDKRFQKYIASLKEPSVDRKDSKYYEDIQKLAYELVKFLRMNDDENEHDNQGNWNMTYLEDNMKPKDFKYVTTRFMKRIPMGELREMIQEHFTESTARKLAHISSGDKKVLLIEKSEVDRYLAKKISQYVGFGLIMGLTLGFGTFWFFN